MRFSERHGYRTARTTFQTTSMDPDLRISLWNVLTSAVWDKVHSSGGGYYVDEDHNSQMWKLCRQLWFSHFKIPLDKLDFKWSTVLDQLRKYFFSCEWHQVYDFLEFVAQNYPYNNRDQFITASNVVLERELAGFRFVGLNIAPITDNAEIDEIDKALAKAVSPVRTHLNRALELMSDRKSPDYRNSIKESISAVESLVQELLGEKGTFGDLIKKLEDEIALHGALKKAFSNLYGYTSDADGIRHALLELNKLTFEDAKFFLVVCSAFVNFVQARVAKKPIT